jgi:hypothetical protein
MNDDVACVVVNRRETDSIVIRCRDNNAKRSALRCNDIRFTYEFAISCCGFFSTALAQPETKND